MTQNEAITVTLVFIFASFLATFGVIVTGFGNALVFLLVYTIADFTGVLESYDMKQAIFLQSISLCGAVPGILWSSRSIIKQHANKKLLLAFIPATVIGTPIGNVLQDVLMIEVIQIIVGSMLTLFSSFKIVQFLIQKNKGGYTSTSSSSNIVENISKDLRQESSETSQNDRKYDIEDKGDDSLLPNQHENEINVEENLFTDDDINKPIETVNDVFPISNLSDGENDAEVQIERNLEEDISLPSHYSFWILGFVMGLLAGFLGGLSGVRSGPLLIFFLYNQYPKDIIRANMLIVAATNAYLRLVYYIIDNQANQRGEKESSWFYADHWYLYISVVLAGLASIPTGLWVEKRIGLGMFNLIILISLLISGMMNIVKGSRGVN